MKRIARFSFISVLLLLTVFAVSLRANSANTAETNQVVKVKQAVTTYFKLRYDIVSKLTYDSSIASLIMPDITNKREAFSEADILDILVQYRASQPNDMRFSKIKYTIVFNSVNIKNDNAWVRVTDNYEFYYNCAPTVKNSGTTTHIINMGLKNGKWLIIKDNYTDPDKISAKLGRYFLKSTDPLNEVKKKVLADLKNQAGKRINDLFTKADFPRLDGSTATYPLSIEIAKALLGLDDTSAKGFIVHNTTHNAYENILNGKADLIFVTPPSDEEIALARKKGIELEIIPVCKEGFVFITNEKNPVKNLSVSEVRDIYQGKIKNWKEVGGEDNKIIPYQREQNSGSQTLMLSIVMKGLPILQAPKETIVMGMGELIDKVADYSNAKNALGYSVYYYATTMYKNRAVKLLQINGIKPDKQTIKDGSYPFIASYYAVLKKSEPSGSSARKLLNWLLSSEGQNIAEKAGFVPVK